MCDTEQMVVDNSELSMSIKVIDALSPIKKCDVIIRNYGNGEPTQVGTGDVILIVNKVQKQLDRFSVLALTIIVISWFRINIPV